MVHPEWLIILFKIGAAGLSPMENGLNPPRGLILEMGAI